MLLALTVEGAESAGMNVVATETCPQFLIGRFFDRTVPRKGEKTLVDINQYFAASVLAVFVRVVMLSLVETEEPGPEDKIEDSKIN